MAKAEKAIGDRQQAGVKIHTKEEADQALKQIGTLQDWVAKTQSHANERSREILDSAQTSIKPWQKEIAALEKEVERWAREVEKSWVGRSLEMTFGRLFFRASSGAIKLVRSVEYVLDHLKAKKLNHCIRTVEEPDKDAIKALDDDIVKEIGCKREKPDYFHYEVFKTEVK